MGRHTTAALNRLSKAFDDASDYEIAKRLGLNKATVSKWRTGKGAMSDETAIAVAKLLHEDPAVLLLLMAEDRAITPGAKALYGQIYRQLRDAAAAGIVVGLGITAFPSAGHTATALYDVVNCILC